MAEVDETGFRGPNQINHVALSVPADLLGEKGQSDLSSFFSEVFGWPELEMMTVNRQRMIFSVHSYSRFLFLLAEDVPMVCPPGLPGDHFGVQVESLEELKILQARAEEFRSRDDRVEILAYEVEDHTVLKLHNFYVRYLLPLSVEVQYFELTPG